MTGMAWGLGLPVMTKCIQSGIGLPVLTSRPSLTLEAQALSFGGWTGSAKGEARLRGQGSVWTGPLRPWDPRDTALNKPGAPGLFPV